MKAKVIQMHDLHPKPEEQLRNLKELTSDALGPVFEAKWIKSYVSWRRFLRLKVPQRESQDVFKQLQEGKWPDVFTEQLNDLKILENENLIKIFGPCVSDTYICVYMEYVWHNPRDCKFSLKEKLELAQVVASTMNKLHEHKIYSFPFEIRHILIRKNQRVALKLAKSVALTNIVLYKLLPMDYLKNYYDNEELVRWQSPEVLLGAAESQESNVFSYGRVLYELLTSKKPFYTIFEPYDISSRVIEGERPTLQEHRTFEPKESALIRLMERCWADPSDRPTFGQILEELDCLDDAFSLELDKLSPLPRQVTPAVRIGTGSQSEIYLATYKDEPVAVKLYKGSESRHEYKILRGLEHKNVCRLKAHSVSLRILVLELGHISLYNVLNDRKRPDPHWARRIQIALDVAEGLQYLHSRKIVHRDLKSLNIVLRSSDESAFLIDFGISQNLGKKPFGAKQKGSVVWMAPDKDATIAADVWSFGMIMYELLTRVIPWLGLNPTEIALALSKGKRPTIFSEQDCPSVAECPGDYKQLMQECWDTEPSKRPSMTNIIARLTKLYGEVRIRAPNEEKYPSNKGA